ncbi:DUF1446 domain-containing protein [Algoriphagus sp. NBT04N3]|jgi:hypothetical protein|uniref:acyclic terpene utilization AtuA family protein n=1 Tax=Algoriphagus sp. NBT04N3 TaxID=2705473 RepID=UPI001C63714E|nr:acyclic terpene utilization AtuA family protein [Algoriphagus sp. NBT04N3]QYH37727.1 DUF1446 domain-containing protein [Algoriphagus sp. NBT04N3]
MKDKIRIGCGAGFAGDRIEPALILTEKGNLDYLVLECLAERTIALAQKRKQHNSSLGYDELLEKRLINLLPLLVKHQTRLITNMGAANPVGAAMKVVEMANKQGISIKVAAVTGDDVFQFITGTEKSLEDGKPINAFGKIISANAYLGYEAILPALNTKADIIITGRVADPSLFLAPMIYEFGWDETDYSLLGKGTVLGHLLECAGQITGGYFADPISKPVPNMEILGHPYVDVDALGNGKISKVAGTGGSITVQTVKEQLLYEVLNPFEYITPDVKADFSKVQIEEIGPDEIYISGGLGFAKPSNLKVSVGYEAGFKGIGEISYAGAHALERGKLAAEIIQKRIGHSFPNLKIDLIGYNSLHPMELSNKSSPYEVRLRVAALCAQKIDAQLIGEEVEALYTNGPAGGGGARKYVEEVIGIVSILLDRKKIIPEFQVFTS